MVIFFGSWRVGLPFRFSLVLSLTQEIALSFSLLAKKDPEQLFDRELLLLQRILEPD